MEDFDEDDLINDYINDDPEPPSDIEENLDVPTDEPMDEEEEFPGQSEAEASRQLFLPEKKEDLYSFERYQGGSWRVQKAESPTTMKAKGWKSHSITIDSPVSKINAPDAQLLSFQKKNTRTRPMRCKMTLHPKAGEKNYTMTLADGNRVYLPKRQVKMNSNNEKNDYALGISMKDLLENVQAIRRQKEHDKNTIEEERHDTLDTDLWVDKHAPSSFVDLLSDERTNREVLRALRAWDSYVFGRGRAKEKDKRPDEQNRVILLSGTPGVGKTTLAHILSKQVGYRPLEINASDERTSTVLIDRVISAMESKTLSLDGEEAKPNCLILDEIDGVDAKQTIPNLVKIIRAERNNTKKQPFIRRPIILICNNKYTPALKPLLPYAKHFDVMPPTANRLVARLRAVLATERLVATNSSLNQLVASSGGDIRSCLYTLQFAAARANRGEDYDTTIDITKNLLDIMNGVGLKDERKDITGTLFTIFQKKKNALGGTRATTRVMEAVETYGDNNRILDYLFLNAMNVSYIDPTFDRCSALHEWLSFAQLSRNDRIISATSAALHLFCRVEQRPSLMFSLRENAELRFQHETNRSLIRRFSESMSPHVITGSTVLTTEMIPYTLWILSAGDGAGSLVRAASSREVLHAREQLVFDAHVSILNSLGLSYRIEEERSFDKSTINTVKMVLEPPIDRLVAFAGLTLSDRVDIPFAMKKLLTERAKAESVKKRAAPKDVAIKQKSGNPNKRESPEKSNETTANKKPKPSPSLDARNFLGVQARKVKKSKSAKTAARVGVSGTKMNRVSHTGSNIPMQQVVRLKHVKGFTQAVRTPCHLEDLM